MTTASRRLLAYSETDNGKQFTHRSVEVRSTSLVGATGSAPAHAAEFADDDRQDPCLGVGVPCRVGARWSDSG
jgi:hypothetical protein